MLNRLLAFTHALREAGVPVSVSESIDSLQALGHVEFEDRTAFRTALATTMIKSRSHEPTFEALFNVYFDGGGPPEMDDLADADDGAGEAQDFMDELFESIVAGNGGAGGMGEFARRAVGRFGRVENSPSDSRYFEYPVFRTLDMDVLLQRLQQQGADVAGLDGIDARIAQDRFRAAVAAFRAEVRAEVQRRVARRKGPEAVTRHSIRPLPEDIDLATASRAEMDEMRKAIRPLARKLATRTAMKRRHAARGGLDVRRTIRRSLSTGGVPLDISLKHKVPHKPELFVLCDISSSVARFARFSLMLVHAMSSGFTKVRSFVFIDTIDEVTHLFESDDLLAAVDRVNSEANVVWIDGHSNYGASLERFLDRYGKEVTAKSTLLILGDARNNHRAPREEALKQLQTKAKHVYWLNPEPEAYWDTGDSAASRYAAYTDGMFEVRTLRHLEDFTAQVLS
jgi:uncharacterized protein with von Willebrand factor type A (vWA) domain